MTKDEAVEFLEKNIVYKQTVYTFLKSVSSSGTSRQIAVLIIKDKEIWNISREVSEALGYKLNKRGDAVCISGCGMDMGFSLVYALCGLFPFHYYNRDNREETPSADGTNCYGLNHNWL